MEFFTHQLISLFEPRKNSAAFYPLAPKLSSGRTNFKQYLLVGLQLLGIKALHSVRHHSGNNPERMGCATFIIE